MTKEFTIWFLGPEYEEELTVQIGLCAPSDNPADAYWELESITYDEQGTQVEFKTLAESSQKLLQMKADVVLQNNLTELMDERGGIAIDEAYDRWVSMEEKSERGES